MEAPIRLSNLDRPPPYIEASAADPHAKELPPSIEALPAYAAVQPRISPPSRSKSTFLKRYKRLLLSLLLFLIITGIVVGTVVGVLLYRKALKNAGLVDPTNPAVKALSATECDGGSFVLYQGGFASIWVQGTIGNGIEIPPTIAIRTDSNGRVAVGGTGLSAACFANGTTMELHIFYLSLGTTSGYNINEAIMEFPDYNINSNYSSYSVAQIPSLTQTSLVEFVVANSNLAATYLPRNQMLHLAYISNAKDVMMLSNHFGSGWDDPVSLHAMSKYANGPLAVASIDREERAQQVMVTFMGTDGLLGSVLWFEFDGWRNASSWKSNDIPSMSSVGHLALTPPSTPNQGGTSFTTYLIASNHRPYSWEVGYLGDGPSTENRTTWPDAMANPGLVATAVNPNGTETNLYYVLRDANIESGRGYDIVRMVGTAAYVDPKTGVTTWDWDNVMVLSDGSPFTSL